MMQIVPLDESVIGPHEAHQRNRATLWILQEQPRQGKSVVFGLGRPSEVSIVASPPWL